MRFKRIAGILLAVALVFPQALPLSVHAASKFSDTSGHWAENYINTAVSKSIINGYPDGRFIPNKAVSRAEFCSMINKALGNTGTTSVSFSDTSRGDWYYNDVAKAVAAAYTAGYSDKTFRPDSPISRQEAAVMLSRIIPAYGSDKNLNAYPDSGNIASWAYDSMEKICGKGYMGAYDDGRIHPQDNLTRAQTAKIICDIMDKESIITTNTIVDDDGKKYSGKIFANNITMDEDLEDDSASIENCVVLGSLIVNGGGTETITVTNSRVVNATVNKDDDAVRLLAKGETSILGLTAYKESILQTSGLSGGSFGSGFSDITASSSSNVTLRGGTFPKVTISGSKATLILDTGTVSNMEVNGSGSNITADSGTTISTVTVNKESYFHGTGTISKMYVNADNVTYETKPKSWTIASSAETPAQADAVTGDITFSPKNGATNVKLDIKPTLTFKNAIEMKDGDSISGSDIEDFIELRKSSSSGTKVSFSATISSTKKVITITPDSNLSKDTKYYLILLDDSIQDDDGDELDKASIYFTTGDDTGSLTTTYTPSDGATTISVNPTIKITFSEAVVQYSDGSTISASDDYLEDCIVFKKTSSSGSNVSYSATIDTAKKVITITPKSALTLNQKYYLAIVTKTLKTKADSEAIPASSATWTTGVTTPSLSNFNTSVGDTSITATITPNVAGKLYSVVVTSGSSAPSAAQIAAGQNSTGVAALGSAKNESVSAATPATLPSIGGLASGTSYDIWATLYSIASSTYSTPVKQTFTTTVPRITLDSLSVKPIVSGSADSEQITFRSGTYSYSVNLNTSMTEVEISADGDSSATITMEGSGLGTATDTGSLTRTVTIDSNPTITVTISSPGKTSSSYTIHLSSEDDTSLKSLRIDGHSQSVGDSDFTYDLTTSSAVSVTLEIRSNDPYAEISDLDGSGFTVTSSSFPDPGSASYTIEIPEGSAPDVEFTVTSGSDSTPTYKITFTRP